MTKDEATAEVARLSKATGGRYYATRYALGAWKVKERYVTPDKSEGAERTTLPTDPCFKCGARGWCDHRQPEPVPAPIGKYHGGGIVGASMRLDDAAKPKLSAEDTVRLMREKGWTL